MVECPTITAAVAYKMLNPESRVVMHHEDHWHHSRAKQDLESVPEELRPELHLGADAPAGPYDAVATVFPQVGMAELLRETVRNSANQLLRRNGLFYAGYYGESEGFLLKELRKAFGPVTVSRTARRHSFAYVARRPVEPLVNAALPWSRYTIREGQEVLEIQARVGVFCHDRLDNGTRALLAVARLPETGRVLDLGCGAGVVSVALGKRLPGIQLTCLDSSARAIESARRNLETHGLADRVEYLLHSEPAEAVKSVAPFDAVITNPPYYGNWRIAETFLTASAEALRPGGTLILVTKGPNWFRENLPETLQYLDTELRGGYSVMHFRKISG
jgi:16S rRNA (guanine1207-N2)-methyltransferase